MSSSSTIASIPIFTTAARTSFIIFYYFPQTIIFFVNTVGHNGNTIFTGFKTNEIIPFVQIVYIFYNMFYFIIITVDFFIFSVNFFVHGFSFQ